MRKKLIFIIMFVVFITGCKNTNETTHTTTLTKTEESTTKIIQSTIPTSETTSEQEVNSIDLWNISSMDLNGNEINLKELISSHSLTLINFWGTYCGPCKIELPDLQKISTDYASDNVAVIAIALDVTAEQEQMIQVADQIFKELGVEFPSLLNNEEIAKKLASGIFAVPTSVLIDSQGNIVENPIIGAQSYDFFAKLIESAL